ncbi:MAG: cysteine desulfurase [Lachnospiraceae bacterium]|nr:cysteine desulfurase [Lachnospiraceae bacterium]
MDTQTRIAKVDRLRADFPLLGEWDLAYLDNAATTQKPVQVLEAVKHYYEAENANPLRGVYALSELATERYEEARALTAELLGAARPEEIVFTRNATESLNLLAYSYGSAHLKEGDEVIVSALEHHSNFLPWKAAAERAGAKLIQLPCTPEGELTAEALSKVLSERTKIVAMTQVSNVMGRKNDLRPLIDMAHAAGAVTVVDGAQSVPHMQVNVRELDTDFLVFSGHKMMAPMGIGALYGKYELLDAMPPFLTGGEMIETVHWDRIRYAQVPTRFEAGTVNAGGAVGLGAAIRYIRDEVGFDFIEAQESALVKIVMDGLSQMEGITVIGSQKAEDHKGIVTFMVDDVHPHDVASILSTEKVAIRAGHHCAQPLMDFLGVKSTCRVSFAFYNTEEEAEAFLRALGKVRGLMGYGK